MKPKRVAKLKRSPSKPKKPKALKSKSRPKAALPPAPSRPRPLQQDPRFAQAVDNYQAGIKAMQERKFERAKGFFDKVVKGSSKELADRATVHMNICNRELARASTAFKTPEEHYDYAVSLMNQGDYDNARTHLDKIIKQHPKADYAVYGLAVLDCLQNRVEESLRHLGQAIRMNPRNRIHARNDTDFTNLADDPRFTELLYPEPGVEPPPAPPPGRGR